MNIQSELRCASCGGPDLGEDSWCPESDRYMTHPCIAKPPQPRPRPYQPMYVYQIYNSATNQYYVRGNHWGPSGSVLTTIGSTKSVMNRLRKRYHSYDALTVIKYEMRSRETYAPDAFLEL